jgi:hypothetical protein
MLHGTMDIVTMRWPSSLAVRMPPCHGGGRRFKSDLGRHYLLMPR